MTIRVYRVDNSYYKITDGNRYFLIDKNLLKSDCRISNYPDYEESNRLNDRVLVDTMRNRKVGDVVDGIDELSDLPDGSIVTAEKRVYRKTRGEWKNLEGFVEPVVNEPVTIFRIGDA